MSPAYTIGPEAYYKIFFHAAKHPHKSVNGVLLGTQDPQHPGSAVEIADAVPLLHHWTSLSPMMEIGLDLASQYADSVGMKVVGYYQACERLDDTALAPVGEKVASKIKAQFEDAIAFVLDGDKLGTSEAALIPYFTAPSTVSWRPVQSGPPAFTPGSTFQLTNSDLPIQAVKMVQEQNLHFAFGDFDDHLEDVTIALFCIYQIGSETKHAFLDVLRLDSQVCIGEDFLKDIGLSTRSAIAKLDLNLEKIQPVF